MPYETTVAQSAINATAPLCDHQVGDASVPREGTSAFTAGTLREGSDPFADALHGDDEQHEQTDDQDDRHRCDQGPSCFRSRGSHVRMSTDAPAARP